MNSLVFLLFFFNVFSFFFLNFIFEKETETEHEQGRGRETEFEAGSRLLVVSTEPETGLQLTSCDLSQSRMLN